MVKSEKSRREIYNQIELKRISIETRDRQPYDLSHILPEQKYNLKLLYFNIYVCLMYMMLCCVISCYMVYVPLWNYSFQYISFFVCPTILYYCYIS